MPTSNVTHINGKAIERIAVEIPRAGVEGICERMFAIEAAMKCVAVALESDDGTFDCSDASLVLRRAAKDLSGLYCDLDVSTWPAVQS